MKLDGSDSDVGCDPLVPRSAENKMNKKIKKQPKAAAATMPLYLVYFVFMVKKF